jgi:hypothetical protein
MARQKRRQIIREIDFNKLPKTDVAKYESVTFTPLTKAWFEKRATFFYLKNKKYLADQFALNDYPDSMLRRFTSFDFYKDEYKYWLLKYNTEGELVIRAGLRQPESRLGFVTFKEKTRVA